MNGHVIELTPTLRMVVGTERERLTGFLAAIQTAEAAELALAALDTPEVIDTATWRDVEEAFLLAEDRVLALARDPGLANFLELILKQLNDIAGDVSG